jgi:FkbM family methyltransferase
MTPGSSTVAAPAATPDWDAIAARIRATPEFARIPLHPKAGLIEDNRQYFFDGGVTTYPWGEPGLHRLVELTRGAPEPQEILPYLEAFDTLPRDATVVELGAGWAFYTVVAGRRLPQSKLFAVEANPQLLEITRRNIALNGLADRTTVLHAAAWNVDGETLNFREAGYGSWVHHRGEYAVPSLSVDGFRATHGLNRIHVLHMDVQGAELKVLDGAARSLAEATIDHVFIGTHSDELHEQCRARLEACGFTIVVSHDLSQSASGDGVLVGRRL